MKQKDDTIPFDQLEQIAQGLAETFSPFCEVVLHDLRDPRHTSLAIHDNLSGHEVGEPATELGLARIADPKVPRVIADYSNAFADGRRAKSTSIGIKDAHGRYVAARRSTTPRTLRASERKILLRELEEAGFMEVRHATETVGAHLGVARSTIHADSR